MTLLREKKGAVYSMGYNGHRDTLYLSGLKNTPDELLIEFDVHHADVAGMLAFQKLNR